MLTLNSGKSLDLFQPLSADNRGIAGSEVPAAFITKSRSWVTIQSPSV